MATEDFETVNPYEYRGLRVNRGVCKLAINYKLQMVICSERPDNYGTSITDYVDKLAMLVCHDFCLNPARLIWIEHLTKNGKETYDLVAFRCEDGELHSPTWQRLTKQEFDEYVLLAGI